MGGDALDPWADQCFRCHGTGQEPVFRAIPYIELTRWQTWRERRFEGVYYRNQFGDTYFARNCSRA